MPGILFFFQISNLKYYIFHWKMVNFSWEFDRSRIFYFKFSIFDRFQDRSGRGNRESNSVGLSSAFVAAVPYFAAVLAESGPRGDFASRASPGGAETLPSGAPRGTNISIFNKGPYKWQKFRG
jgi:hypothetical protein